MTVFFWKWIEVDHFLIRFHFFCLLWASEFLSRHLHFWNEKKNISVVSRRKISVVVSKVIREVCFFPLPPTPRLRFGVRQSVGFASVRQCVRTSPGRSAAAAASALAFFSSGWRIEGNRRNWCLWTEKKLNQCVWFEKRWPRCCRRHCRRWRCRCLWRHCRCWCWNRLEWFFTNTSSLCLVEKIKCALHSWSIASVNHSVFLLLWHFKAFVASFLGLFAFGLWTPQTMLRGSFKEPSTPKASGLAHLMTALHQNAAAVVNSKTQLNGPDQVGDS